MEVDSISVTDILMKPLTPAVFHILLALSAGERHGYAIMREVAAETGNSFTMGPGTLYGTLVRMLDAGLVEERRRYYRITSKGRRAAVDEAKRLDALVRSARKKSLLGRIKA
jgi:DNA-binding PadR family transcriptional regulator